MKLRPFFFLDRFKRAYLIKRNSVPTVGLGKSEKCICKTFLKINISSLIVQKKANKADYPQSRAPPTGPPPCPTPSQKQKHVTSGSTCLTHLQGGKAAAPRTTECHLQLWGPATPEHTLTQGTFSNRIKYQEVGGHVLLLKMKKKKKVPSSKSISQTLYNRRSIAVTYMGTYRVELYRASQPTGRLAATVVFLTTHSGNTALNRDLFPKSGGAHQADGT